MWQFKVYLAKMMRMRVCLYELLWEMRKGLSGMLIKAVKTQSLVSWQSQQVRIRKFLSPSQPLVGSGSCWNIETSGRDSVSHWWQIHDGFLRLIKLFGILDSKSLCVPRLSVNPYCLYCNYFCLLQSPSTPNSPPGGTPWPVDAETSTMSDSFLNFRGLAQRLTHSRCTIDLEWTNEWMKLVSLSVHQWVCSSPHLPGCLCQEWDPKHGSYPA